MTAAVAGLAALVVTTSCLVATTAAAGAIWKGLFGPTLAPCCAELGLHPGRALEAWVYGLGTWVVCSTKDMVVVVSGKLSLRSANMGM